MNASRVPPTRLLDQRTIPSVTFQRAQTKSARLARWRNFESGDLIAVEVTTHVDLPDQLNLAWTAPLENDGAPAASAQRLANVYDMRYSTAPITTQAAWDAAQRFLPSEWVSGDKVPAVPGVAQAVTFRSPSAFESY